MLRRWRGLLARRGTFQPVPPAPVAPQVQAMPPGRLTRNRPAGLAARRGRFHRAAPPSPARSASLIEGRRSAMPGTRRGHFLPVPPSTVTAPPAAFVPSLIEGRRAVLPATRRGEFVTPTYSPLPVPAFRSSRRPVGNAARSRYATGPLVGVVAPTPQPVPPGLGRAETRREMVARRGRFHPVPLVGLSPAAPTPPADFRPRRRGYTTTTRHGEFLYVPSGNHPPPARVTRRDLRRLTPGRAGTFLSFIAAPAAPPTAKPIRFLGRRSRHAAATRRGQFLNVPPVGAAFPFTPAAAERTLTVVAENRVLTAAADLRLETVEADPRSLTASAESRTTIVPADPRTMEA